MTEPAGTPVESLNLEPFERVVYLRDGSPESFEACARELYGILQRIRKGSGFFGCTEDQLRILHTRLAGAVTSLFTDPKFFISADGFVRLCAEHTTLHSIFRASSYETMDHVLSTIGTRPADEPLQMQFAANTIAQLLLCWSLESEVEVDFDVLYAAAPEATHAAIIGMLAIGVTHTERAYKRRLHLMSLRHILCAHPLPDALLLCAGDLYMHCTYTDAPDKHEAKKIVNTWMRDLAFSRTEVRECTRKLVRKERPTIVVPVEWFGSHHAMFRCYAPSMRQLKERFRLVCIYRDTEIDEGGMAVFDKCVKLPGDAVAISTIMEVIHAEEPDIMFYPSVGMAAWYVALSNIRMAPIQVCCPGHPASTFSNVMDYMACEEDLFGVQDRYSERLVGLPVGAARYIPREGVTVPVPMGADARSVLRVAIPAMAVKIIPPFLSALKEIKSACQNVEYHFFPNQVSLAHYVCAKDLHRWFPDCVVHPRSSYQEYIDNLASCKLALSTFPFGGTNSIIDCFLYGVPVVTLEGDEIHQRSDASMIRRMKFLRGGLIHQNVKSFINGAVEIIKSGDFNFIPIMSTDYEFFGEGWPAVQGKFLAAFEQLYEEKLNEQS